MSSLQREAQSLNPSAIISLYTLDCRSIGGSVYRFTADKEPDGTNFAFGGEVYQQISLKAEGFEWNGDGSYPRPKISVSVLNETFYSLIVFSSGAQGALLTRVRTLAKFLDGHEYGGQSIHFPADIYFIDRVTALTKSAAELELISPLDLPRCRIPSRAALRDLCPWVYRVYDSSSGTFEYDQTGNACPYTGSACFDRYGSPCDAASDVCGRRMSDCVKRFGTLRALPYGGFPGLARTRA